MTHPGEGDEEADVGPDDVEAVLGREEAGVGGEVVVRQALIVVGGLFWGGGEVGEMVGG